MIMTINNAIETKDYKGLYIYFYRDEVTHIDDIFSITYQDKERYFIVTEVKVDKENMLLIKAKEYGYYNQLFGDIDIRILIDKDVKYVNDKEIIKQLENEACYC